MLGMPGWRVNRLLQVHPGMDVAQEELRGPLILLIATRRPPHEIGFTVAQCQARRQSRPRPLTRRERGGMLFVQPENLRAGPETETKFWDNRRGLVQDRRRRTRHTVTCALRQV